MSARGNDFIESDIEREDAHQSVQQTARLGLHTAAASMVWAGRAVDKIQITQPRKQHLKMAARQLKISPTLCRDMPDKGLWPI